MAENEPEVQHSSTNLKLATVVSSLASVIAAQNQMLMQMTDRIAEAKLLQNPTAKDSYFSSFTKVLNETTTLNSSIKELIVALQNEDIAAIQAANEE